MADRKITDFVNTPASGIQSGDAIPLVRPGAGSTAAANRRVSAGDFQTWAQGTLPGQVSELADQTSQNTAAIAGKADQSDLDAVVAAEADTRAKILTRMGSVPTVDRDAEIVADPVSKRTIRRTDRLGRQIDGRGLALVAEPDVALALPRLAQMRLGPLTVERDAEIIADPLKSRVARRTDRLGRQYGDYRTLSGSPLLSADMVAEYVSALPSYGYGLDSLWRTAEKRRGIELGQDQQLVISIIGDSWTGSRGYWVEALTLHLRSLLGDAGPGWFGFAASSSGSIVQGATTDIAVTRSGTWTDLYGTGDSPDAGQVVSSTAGDRYTLTGPAGLSDLQLFGSSGTIRYSWDAGATWTDLALTGDALQTNALAGLPAGAWTLWFEVVSGTVKLSGVNALKAGPGVRVNKLGKNGTHTAQWASIDEADFAAGHSALGSDLVIVHHGTNDQWLSGQVTSTPAEYEGYVDTIVARLRAAVPVADILLSTPPSARTDGYPMAEYAAAMRRIAIARQVAHVDLQFRFGRNLDEYEFGADRELLNNTLIHPTTTGGRAVLVDAIANIIDRS